MNYKLDVLIAQAHGGVGLKHVTRWMVDNLEIPLPSIEEQRRIAAILDQADGLRRKRREANERLCGLAPATFIQMFGEPRKNPHGFPAATLADIVRFVGGSQPPKSTFLYEGGPDRVRFVQTRDFKTDAYKTFVPRSLARRLFSKDDVMIGRYGPPVFQIFKGLSGTYNVALMKAEPRKGILKEFVFYLLQEKNLQHFVVSNSERTAGQSGVNLALLEACPAYVPPLDLQRAFAARVDEIDKLKAWHHDHLAHLDSLFASLQHLAFRGEL
jgi:type I restriction enzyme S subunit